MFGLYFENKKYNSVNCSNIVPLYKSSNLEQFLYLILTRIDSNNSLISRNLNKISSAKFLIIEKHIQTHQSILTEK